MKMLHFKSKKNQYLLDAADLKYFSDENVRKLPLKYFCVFASYEALPKHEEIFPIHEFTSEYDRLIFMDRLAKFMSSDSSLMTIEEN